MARFHRSARCLELRKEIRHLSLDLFKGVNSIKEMNYAILKYLKRFNRAKALLAETPTHRYTSRLKHAIFRWPHLLKIAIKNTLWMRIFEGDLKLKFQEPTHHTREGSDFWKPDWVHRKIHIAIVKMRCKRLIQGKERKAFAKKVLSISTTIPEEPGSPWNMESDSDTERDEVGDLSNSDDEKTSVESEDPDKDPAPPAAPEAPTMVPTV